MSREKVERYKKEKANRKQTMKKNKIKAVVKRTVYSLAALAAVVAIGYNVYAGYEAKKPRVTAQINYDDLNNYMSGLNTEE